PLDRQARLRYATGACQSSSPPRPPKEGMAMACKLLLTSLVLLSAAVPVRGRPVMDVPLTESGSPGEGYRPTVRDPGIDGRWQLVSAERDGEKVPEEALKTFRVTFRQGNARVEVFGEVKDAAYDLDLRKRPVAIDFRYEEKVELGILVLRGNTLILCMADT